MTKRTLFGTDGIRGKANIHPMTCEVAMALGRAVTVYFQRENEDKRPVIIIGKDTRLSGYMLEQAFSSGVCSQGGQAILTGPMPTPAVAFVTQSMRADAGVMISASHNVFSDNGIKIFDRFGNKLPDEIELELEKMVLNPSLIPCRLDDELGRAKRLEEVTGRYIVQVKSAFHSSYGLEGLRLVLDCANGAAYKVAPMVFQELGADVVTISNTPTGTNINDNCGALHPKACAEKVKEYRADIGICLDGDADRLVIIDELGDVVPGDKLLGLCAKFLLDKGELGEAHEVVGTEMSNMGLENYLKNLGVNFTRVKVGDRYICEHMKKSGAIFGGEPSGHIIFNRYATTGDGILAALKILECCKFYNRPLHQLIKEIPLYPQILRNVVVESKPPFDSIPEIKQALDSAQKELGNEGRILLRYSGTETLARVMIEGKDNAKINNLCNHLVEVIGKALSVKEA